MTQNVYSAVVNICCPFNSQYPSTYTKWAARRTSDRDLGIAWRIAYRVSRQDSRPYILLFFDVRLDEFICARIDQLGNYSRLCCVFFIE